MLFQAIGVAVLAFLIVAGVVSTLRRVNGLVQQPQKRNNKK